MRQLEGSLGQAQKHRSQRLAGGKSVETADPTGLPVPLRPSLSSFQDGPRADSGDSLIVPKDQGERRRLALFFSLEVEISDIEH